MWFPRRLSKPKSFLQQANVIDVLRLTRLPMPMLSAVATDENSTLSELFVVVGAQPIKVLGLWRNEKSCPSRQ